MNLRVFDSLEELHRAVARTLVQRVTSAAEGPSASLRAGSGAPLRTVAISGGSTPVPLYRMLGESPWRDELAQMPITWVVVDERYVPTGDPQSNAGMIERTLFANGLSPSHRFLRFRTELNDPAATARAFEEEWKSMGLETLDVVMLGVGDDGHTASLFPGTPVLEVEDRIASEVFVPKLDAWRVTITKPVIRAAGVRLVIAPGKQKVIDELRAGVRHPIALATEGLDSWWFVDRSV